MAKFRQIWSHCSWLYLGQFSLQFVANRSSFVQNLIQSKLNLSLLQIPSEMPRGIFWVRFRPIRSCIFLKYSIPLYSDKELLRSLLVAGFKLNPFIWYHCEQCDHMATLFVNIWPFTIIKIGPIVAKVCSKFCQVLNRSSRNFQRLLKFHHIWSHWLWGTSVQFYNK